MAITMVNGIAYSASNVTVLMFGRAIAGITKLDYKKKQDKTNNKAFQVEPVSRGYGNADYDCSMEIYRDEWMGIIDSAPNNDPTQIPPFTFSVTFSGDGVNFKEDQILFAEFLEDSLTVGAGDTSIKVTVPMIIGGIKHI